MLGQSIIKYSPITHFNRRNDIKANKDWCKHVLKIMPTLSGDHDTSTRPTPVTKQKRLLPMIGKKEFGIKRIKVKLAGDAGEKWVAASRDKLQEGEEMIHSAVVDTICYRYQREIGFLKDGEDLTRYSEMNEEQKDLIETAAALHRDKLASPSANSGKLKGWISLECYVLKELNTHPWAVNFLNKVVEELKRKDETAIERNYSPTRILYVPPPHDIIVCWIQHCIKRDNVKTTIKILLSNISSCNIDFGGSRIVRSSYNLDAVTADYEGIYAQAFDVATDLDYVYAAVFSMYGKKTWTWLKCVEIWTMFLVQCAVIGRVSCVTTYCPTWTSVHVPEMPGFFCKDGIPNNIRLSWLDWKHRKATGLYPIALVRNPCGSKFCPVYWICTLYNMQIKSGIDVTDEKTKIFNLWEGTKNTAAKSYGQALKGIFRKASDLSGKKYLALCSGHSPRRSLAMAAKRCDLSLEKIMDVGRWLSVTTLHKYLGSGLSQAEDAVRGSLDKKDPIYKVWPFMTYSVNITTRGSIAL